MSRASISDDIEMFSDEPFLRGFSGAFAVSSAMPHTPPNFTPGSYELSHMKRARAGSISGRLRSASDLEEKGYIDKGQKGILKDMIISGDAELQTALDKYEGGDPSQLNELMDKGLLNRRDSLDLLQDLDMDFLNVGLGTTPTESEEAMSGRNFSAEGPNLENLQDAHEGMHEMDLGVAQAVVGETGGPTDQFDLGDMTFNTTFEDHTDTAQEDTDDEGGLDHVHDSNSPFDAMGGTTPPSPGGLLRGLSPKSLSHSVDPLPMEGLSSSAPESPGHSRRHSYSITDDLAFGGSSYGRRDSISSFDRRLSMSGYDRRDSIGGLSALGESFKGGSYKFSLSNYDGLKHEADGLDGSFKFSSQFSFPFSDDLGSLDLAADLPSFKEEFRDLDTLSEPMPVKVKAEPTIKLTVHGPAAPTPQPAAPTTSGISAARHARLMALKETDFKSSVPLPNGHVGAYSPTSRKKRIERFMAKREQRVWTKTVKYDVRKSFADTRMRVKGRFVKKDDEAQLRELMALV